jgi:2-amino-4-hydroxy-6-hydroxymethyldihydropteridine diphosphokinase
MSRWIRVALGLGGNLGDRLGVLRQAVEKLSLDVLQGAKSSSVYETPPWGILNQPDFLNLVVTGDSQWQPPAILNYAKSLERELGRQPGERFGPRLIDIDLIAYGEQVWDSEGLAVPHPRMAERSFVLHPLRELWPEWTHPVSGKTVTTLCDELPAESTARIRVFAPAFSTVTDR